MRYNLDDHFQMIWMINFSSIIYQIYIIRLKLLLTIDMKKTRESKDIKRTTQNFFKYIQPNNPVPTQKSKVHTRSMIELDQNNQHQSARYTNYNKENHHSSVCNQQEPQQMQTIKSNSLKKFLSLFGTNASTNTILNAGIKAQASSGRQEKKSVCNSGRQVFTCNIKNMNVNVSNSKDTETQRSVKPTLILKKEKLENNSFSSNCQKIDHQEQIIKGLKKSLEDSKDRESSLKSHIQNLEKQNQNIKQQKKTIADEIMLLQERYLIKERQLGRKIEVLEKQAGKEKCREHELVIQSLKKVINEQLRKIIELEKSKIQRDEIQKLEDRINKNMTMNCESVLRQKVKFMEDSEHLMKRKDGQQIKIQDDCFSESMASSVNDVPINQTIQEATEEEEESVSRQQEDSILQEVDKYLTQWRSKC